MMKKTISYCIKTPLTAFFLLLLCGIAGHTATDFLGMGYMVSGTPFDAKVRSAGCFNIPTALYMPLGIDRESIETLFTKARSFRYVPDGPKDIWQTAEETEARRAGDCEDKAIWLFSRLIQSGYYNVRLVIGKYRSFDSRFHVWVICSDKEGNTCLLDPSVQKRIWYLTAVDSGFYKPLYAFDGQNRYRYFLSK